MQGITILAFGAAIVGAGWASDGPASSRAKNNSDFRLPTESKWIAPRAVVDPAQGVLVATAEIPTKPQRVFDLFTTKEIEQWWKAPGIYHLEDFKSDLRVQGKWNVIVRIDNVGTSNEWGEYCEIKCPNKLVITRRFEKNPLLSDRETTTTYRFEPTEYGTRVTVREEGLLGHSDAVYGNAEDWERVLGYLSAYLGASVTQPTRAQAQAPTKDFRRATEQKWRAPRAVVDAAEGTILATAEVLALPDRVFDLFTTDEIQRWWQAPGYYHWEDFKSDLRVQGQWSVLTRFDNGDTNKGWGEYCEIDRPRKLVMTRRFEKHPLLGHRETTITYRFEPTEYGTRVTVRDQGFLGRSEAAFGNAEHWERVLGWLAKCLGAAGSAPRQ